MPSASSECPVAPFFSNSIAAAASPERTTSARRALLWAARPAWPAPYCGKAITAALTAQTTRRRRHRPTVPVLTPNVLCSTSNFCDRLNITFAIGVP